MIVGAPMVASATSSKKVAATAVGAPLRTSHSRIGQVAITRIVPNRMPVTNGRSTSATPSRSAPNTASAITRSISVAVVCSFAANGSSGEALGEDIGASSMARLAQPSSYIAKRRCLRSRQMERQLSLGADDGAGRRSWLYTPHRRLAPGAKIAQSAAGPKSRQICTTTVRRTPNK
jgi:hypothetical protein